jgi:hypothetical protein
MQLSKFQNLDKLHIFCFIAPEYTNLELLTGTVSAKY